ncbi:hypothetical protein [Ruminococcus sp.]|uniref:hypothetical protein n=1 Tax=Ruminococcus sp. TaxID=41978 RepID=UPI0025E571F1|nr:hypothetical protein [Ruminococcus sp.]MBQ6253019.1 hypothetical protein [Ruminococcus sp.]
MNKKITLKMKENKDISILRDDTELISISKDNRTIKADEIFKLFDYNSGDTYEIQKENEKSLDEPVLNFFYDLIKEISDQIISYKDEEDEYANIELVGDIKDYKMDN